MFHRMLHYTTKKRASLCQHTLMRGHNARNVQGLLCFLHICPFDLIIPTAVQRSFRRASRER